MNLKINKQQLIIFSVFLISSFAFPQDKQKFKNFEYEEAFKEIKITADDGSFYLIENIIIAVDTKLGSEYEQGIIRKLYNDTQDYFISLIGKYFTAINNISNSKDHLIKLDDGNIINYDLIKRGLAVFNNPPNYEQIKYEEEGFDINQRDALLKYVYLLSESTDRKKEINSLINIYAKKYQEDYFWSLLKLKEMQNELGSDLNKTDPQQLVYLKKALDINPKLIDLNIDIALVYSRDIDSMTKNEKPINYYCINEFIKYALSYLSHRTTDIRNGQLYLLLANAYLLKEEYAKSLVYIKKYLNEKTKPSKYDSSKENKGITFSIETFMTEYVISKIGKYDVENIRTLLNKNQLYSKIKIYEEIISLIKNGKIEYITSPTEQDELRIKDLMKEYYLVKNEKYKYIRNTILVNVYVFLGIFTIIFCIICFKEIKKKRKKYLYVSIVSVLLIIVGSLFYVLKIRQAEKKNHDNILKIKSEISDYNEKEKQREVSKNKAIELAKNNSPWIRNIMEKKKGDLKIIGWQAIKQEENIYIVSFTYKDENKKETVGWYFEVQLTEEVVRIVTGNEELEKKYGLKRVDLSK